MKRFKRILCVVDAKQQADAVLDRAVALARNNQAVLTVVMIAPTVTAGIGLPERGPIPVDLQQAVVTEAAQQLEEILAPYRSQAAIDAKVLEGTPFLEVIREVLRQDHDLVIKAPEDPDWLARLFGSDDMHLLRKCPCPVWFVKPAPAGSYRRILAAIDAGTNYAGAELANRRGLNVKVLELASSLSVSESAEFHVAHAWEMVGENALRSAFLGRPEDEVAGYLEQVRRQHEEALDALLADVLQPPGQGIPPAVTATRHLVKGTPRTAIPALASRIGADLLVMGTVARTGGPGFFIGNTAEAILEQVTCSVLAVKPDGFVTPVGFGA
jgi:nucleotide-binding universal stress UspA family protein